MKILLFSSLFPSSVRPVHGIFVETRLRELLKTGEISAKVVAPVPWFPFTSPHFGHYAQFAATPRAEHRNGLEVHHPRYALLPKVGMHLAPRAMALGALPTIRRLQSEGFDFDLIDAHYYYPDGVAASLLARWLKKPFFVTARGSDINLIAEMPRPRRKVLAAAQAAAYSIGVSKALADRLVELGAPGHKVATLRNGVDPEMFEPQPRDVARRRLGVAGAPTCLLMVGNLVELKGHAIAIEALSRLPDAVLCLVGAGPEEGSLKALAVRLQVQDRVRFVGQVPQADLKWWYSAADALLLCSSREGWPNVLLEAMACGTPVVSTAVSGTPDIVSAEAAGVLMAQRDVASLISAWQLLKLSNPSRAATRAHALRFAWSSTSQGQLELFRGVL
jgi:glycosyltransferase involved in cell wall biosynthesis